MNVLSDLLDQRQMFGKRLQPRIGGGVDLLDRGGAGGDQRRIDLVVLGQLQVELGIGAHLCRLKHHHNEPIAPQLDDNRQFIAATCLDPNALDLVAPQPLQQRLVTFRRVLDLQLRAVAIERHVELPFAGIDPGADCDTLGHLRRPSLVMRT